MTKLIDTPAAILRDRLVAGEVDRLSETERHLFSTFLILMLIRDPQSIRPKQVSAESEWETSLKEIHDRSAATARSNINLMELYRSQLSGLMRDQVLLTMLSVADDSDLTHSVRTLDWRVYLFPDEAPSLVIADRPIVLSGRNGIIERLATPLSPKALFIAASANYHRTEIVLQPKYREMLAVTAINEQFRKARRFVVSSTLGPNNGYLKTAERLLCLPTEK